MTTEHMSDQQISNLSRGPEFRMCNEVSCLRKPVDNGQNDCPELCVTGVAWYGTGWSRLEVGFVVFSRVTGESGRKGPLKHMCTDRIWDKQGIIRTVTWIMLTLLGLADMGFDLPRDGSKNTGWNLAPRQHQLRCLTNPTQQ